VDDAEAVTHWYDTLYLPIVEIIVRHNVLADFPGRTEADLYLWLCDHLHYLRQSQGDVDAIQAVQDFAKRYSRAACVPSCCDRWPGRSRPYRRCRSASAG